VTTPLLIRKHVNVITVGYTPSWLRRRNHSLYAMCLFQIFQYTRNIWYNLN